MQSVKPVSPLHRRAAHGPTAPTSVAFRAEGQPVPLLHWHVARAFAGVPEATIKKVSKELGLGRAADEGEADEDLQAVEHTIVLDIMRHVNKDLTPEQAQRACCQREDAEESADLSLADLNLDVLRDVVLPGDHHTVRETVEHKSLRQSNRRQHNTQAKKAVAEHFEKKPMTAASKAKSKHEAKASGVVKLKAGTTKDLWRRSALGDCLGFIRTWAPPPLKVIEDNANGRYLLAYPAVGRKSFSWTRRGQNQTAVACVKYAWQVHTEHTGEECPIPEDFFDD